MNAWQSAWFPRLTAHSLAIVVSVLTYVLSTRVEHERRPPSIAIAWVCGLIAIPYLALPLYLLFGRRKLRRKPPPTSRTPDPSESWAEQLIESFGLPPASPAHVHWHRDGAVSRLALFETMAQATRRLDLCTYILGDDAFGREAIAHMIERVRAGVRVRLLIDGVGAIQLPRAIRRQLRLGGVETAVFSSFFARKTSGPRNLRNHRKWVIADEARLWAGGRNLAAEYFLGSPGEAPWCDLSFDLEGRTARDAARQFEADWLASNGAPAAPIGADHASDRAADHAASATTAAAGEGGRGRTQFLPSGPDQSEDTVHALLIDACFHCRQRMLAVTPYFVPDAALETAMRLAARRGVKIDLLLPAKSNHLLADFARSRSLRALAAAGVSIRLLPFMVHAKAVVFDAALALSGSVNLDSRSLLLNYESAVVFYARRDIDWLADWITELGLRAESFDARRPGLLRDVGEGLLLTLAFQL